MKQKREAQQRKDNKKLRPNPAYSIPADKLVDMVSGVASDVLITNAIKHCTYQEKLLIASIMPAIVNLVRSNLARILGNERDKGEREKELRNHGDSTTTATNTSDK